jgi:hypothetical protein
VKKKSEPEAVGGSGQLLEVVVKGTEVLHRTERVGNCRHLLTMREIVIDRSGWMRSEEVILLRTYLHGYLE